MNHNRSNPCLLWAGLPVLVVLFSASCGEGSGSSKKSGAGAWVSLSATASPGELVVLRLTDTTQHIGDTIQAWIDTTAVLVVEKRPDEISVMIPNIGAGPAEINLKSGGNSYKVPITIAEHIGMRVMFRYDQGNLAFLSSTPSSKRFEQRADHGAARILSYDVEDSTGVLLTGTVAHPDEGMEVFEQDGSIRRVPPSGPQVLVLDLPKLKGALTVKFFNADPAQLSTSKDMSQRELIGQVSITQ